LFTAVRRQKVAKKTQRLVTTKICVTTTFQVIQRKKKTLHVLVKGILGHPVFAVQIKLSIVIRILKVDG